MKRLKPPKKTISWFNDISECKQWNIRATLFALKPRIKEYYYHYSNRAKTQKFHRINSHSFSRVEESNLLHCYEVPTRALNLLKKEIISIHNEVVGYTCQYCSVGLPNTYDHYLPKSEFPEYSVLSINLIPCCTRCNQNKGDEWNRSTRHIINLYFDSLTNKQYLFCKIIYNDSIPEINFFLQQNGISSKRYNLIKNHFDKLKLIELYKLKANDLISETTNSIKSYCKGKSKKIISSELLDESSKLKKKHGVNFWNAILKEELAKNKTFLKSVS